jgi:hypothetical protein
LGSREPADTPTAEILIPSLRSFQSPNTDTHVRQCSVMAWFRLRAAGGSSREARLRPHPRH